MEQDDEIQMQNVANDLRSNPSAAIFLDKKGKLRRVLINLNMTASSFDGEGSSFAVKTQNNKLMAMMSLSHTAYDNGAFLDLIDTERKYRGLGAASAMINLAETCMMETHKKYIYGQFSPFELSFGEDQIELMHRARRFYESNDYEIISSKNYNPQNYDPEEQLRIEEKMNHCLNKVIYKKLTNSSLYEKVKIDNTRSLYIHYNVYTKYSKEKILDELYGNLKMKKGI